MAFDWQAWAYRQNIQCAGRKFVLVSLAYRADSRGFCFPGQKYLALMTGQTDRSVRTHLADLERNGLIARTLRRRPDGTRTSDGYQIMADPEDVLDLRHLEQPENIAGSTKPTGNDFQSHRKRFPESPEESSGHDSSGYPSEEPSDSIGDSRQGKENKPNSEAKRQADELEADFERFWSQVPRKVGKGQARRAYKAARKKTGAAEIERAIKSFARQCEGREAQYIPHPATWLNGERWLDEPPPSSREGPSREECMRLYGTPFVPHSL